MKDEAIQQNWSVGIIGGFKFHLTLHLLCLGMRNENWNKNTSFLTARNNERMRQWNEILIKISLRPATHWEERNFLSEINGMTHGPYNINLFTLTIEHDLEHCRTYL